MLIWEGKDIICKMAKLTVGWFFGGRSTEHEVSVITALQAYENLDKVKYQVIPIFVSKEGKFYTNPKFLDLKNYKDVEGLILSSKEVVIARKNDKSGLLSLGLFPEFIVLDLAFPLFHGSFGEDGCIQGVFEIYKIPYVGFNVLGSSIAMDKDLSKSLFKSLGLNVAKSVIIQRNDWLENSKKLLDEVAENLHFPVFVKPADIGSTIGVNKVNVAEDLSFNIEVAAVYSDKIIVEEAFDNCIEVNCAALGYKQIDPSVCEQPIRSSDALSFEDKYMKGNKDSGSKGADSHSKAGMASLSRKIPAPISKKLAAQIQQATIKVFKLLEGCGVARIDYFVDQKSGKFWINEVNSPPGSLAFYLFEPMGIKYKDLLDRLIDDSLLRFADQQKTQFSFESGLLSQMAKSGDSKS